MGANRYLVLAVATVLVGCVADLPSESASDQAVTSTNKVALNKIALNKIALNKIALNKIALNKIALNKIALNTIATEDLLNDAEGREVLSYLIGCAFPAGTSLQGEASDGVTYTFDGSIGLTPKWETRQLTNSEMGWISACMLARVNNFGVSLLISLRGPHPALSVTAEEAAEYTLEEGAFYGDIFSDEGQPQVFIACGGIAQFDGSESDDLTERACARQNEVGGGTLTDCGMQYTGSCTSFVDGDALACEERHGVNADNGYYERCHDQSTTDPKSGWAGTTRYDQVVTVYVHR